MQHEAGGGLPLPSDQGDADLESLSVFLMEADGILANIGMSLVQMRNEDDLQAHVADLRRSFHALKGCSRMVGLHVWANAAAMLEEFMKVWLMHGWVLDDARYGLLLRGYQELRAWTNDLAGQGLSQYRPESLITALKVVLERCLKKAASSDSGCHDIDGQITTAIPTAADILDLELLQVFLEEGRELLWQIGDCLQRLHKTPEDALALQSLLRTVHTIKGSARMVGAMQLGRHLHALESRIGEMAHHGRLSMAMIDELLARHDQGLQLFDALQMPAEEVASNGADAETLAVAVTMPVNGDAGMLAEVDGSRSSNVGPSVRIRVGILDKLLNQAGEISISRSVLDAEVAQLQQWLTTLAGNVTRLGTQLRQIEIGAEIRILARSQKQPLYPNFDPLEFDHYTQLQELTRMLAENVDDVASLHKNLTVTVEQIQNHLLQQGRQTRAMQCELMQARMVQFRHVEDRLQRLVRQLAQETGKPLALEIIGGAVEIDRRILEKMAGPFEHLLRNAVAHGVEAAAERCIAGKDRVGRLSLEATTEGNEVMIRLVDDGLGLKLHHIRATALRNGLIDEGQILTEAELTGFIFHSGFSTNATVTTIAGRGVGLDVVRTEVASLGGRISVESVAGRGTAFIIHLPLSLAVTRVVLLQTGAQTYAIPTLLVEQVVRLKAAEQEQLLRTGSLDWQGRRLALHGLPDLLGNKEGIAMHDGMPVLVIKSGHHFIAVLAERVLGSREVVTKNIGPQLSRCLGIVGATVLGDGSIVLILNPIQLAQRQGYRRQLRKADAPMTALPSDQKLIMVVDDSLTVRRVTQRLLKRVGYRVVMASDGINALQLLQTMRPDIALVDIEMPRMGGFDLVRRLRDMELTAALPIIMITSRTAPKHRQRAMELGVNEYLGKPYQDAVLLRLIAALLGVDAQCGVDESLLSR